MSTTLLLGDWARLQKASFVSSHQVPRSTFSSVADLQGLLSNSTSSSQHLNGFSDETLHLPQAGDSTLGLHDSPPMPFNQEEDVNLPGATLTPIELQRMLADYQLDLLLGELPTLPFDLLDGEIPDSSSLGFPLSAVYPSPISTHSTDFAQFSSHTSPLALNSFPSIDRPDVNPPSQRPLSHSLQHFCIPTPFVPSTSSSFALSTHSTDGATLTPRTVFSGKRYRRDSLRSSVLQQSVPTRLSFPIPADSTLLPLSHPSVSSLLPVTNPSLDQHLASTSSYLSDILVSQPSSASPINSHKKEDERDLSETPTLRKNSNSSTPRLTPLPKATSKGRAAAIRTLEDQVALLQCQVGWISQDSVQSRLQLEESVSRLKRSRSMVETEEDNSQDEVMIDAIRKLREDLDKLEKRYKKKKAK